MCALALANVPHSDDMTDDPFRYLGKHIITRAPKASDPVREQAPLPEEAQGPVLLPTGLGGASAGAYTATPSETSKRETLHSNNTTPMTTPGVTPAETGKRFSDAPRRPSTAAPSSLRTEIKTFKGNAVYSFFKGPLPMSRPQTAASKSLTHLPSSMRTKSKQMTPVLPGATQPSVIGRPDFNKSLPAIPNATTQSDQPLEALPKEKPGAITRMLKTVRLQRTQAPPSVEARSASTDLPRQLEQLKKISETTPTASRKHKFNFSSMFHKRSSTTTKRATVG